MFLKENGQSLGGHQPSEQTGKQGYKRSKVQAEKADIYTLLGNKKAARSELRSAVKSDVRNLEPAHNLAHYQIEDGDC